MKSTWNPVQDAKKTKYYLLNHAIVTEATFAVDRVPVGKDYNHVTDTEATLAVDHVPVAKDYNHSTKLILLPYHKLSKNVPYLHT